MGGLGNQMFEYAAAFAFAERTGRTIRFDTSFFAHDEFRRRFALDAFKLDVRNVGAAAHIRFRVLTWLAKRGLGRFLQAPKVLQDREEGYDPELFNVSSPVILSGYWQSYRYSEGVEVPLRRRFEFRRKPPSAVAAWIERIATLPNATALHVRRKDYVNNPGAARVHGCCDANYYQRAVKQLVEGGVQPHLFIFSDDPEWAQANLRFELPVNIVSGQGGWPDSEDLRMMVACRHFIIANSTFSWWAAWLGKRAGSIVIAPARWYVGKQEPRDLVPLSWIRL